MAIAAGMTICESVTASLDYLVMADPNSTSTKACKARGYGVKLISEDDFLDMVDRPFLPFGLVERHHQTLVVLRQEARMD